MRELRVWAGIECSSRRCSFPRRLPGGSGYGIPADTVRFPFRQLHLNQDDSRHLRHRHGRGRHLAVVAAFRLNEVVGAVFLVIVAPLGFIFALMLWRLVLEFVMVQFRMAEYLQIMVSRDSSRS
ncbi:MAG: hypothetical protein DLM54_03140 [Acidimicrobiales bacterium]|nr:MAG: hypothetical protein DLM54_03140 [Acidimicrobiales bacterium]